MQPLCVDRHRFVFGALFMIIQTLTDNKPGLCRKPQLAEQIGVCQRTINTLISAGMPCIRPSQRLTLFDPIECVSWLKNNYQVASATGYTIARNGGSSI